MYASAMPFGRFDQSAPPRRRPEDELTAGRCVASGRRGERPQRRAVAAVRTDRELEILQRRLQQQKLPQVLQLRVGSGLFLEHVRVGAQSLPVLSVRGQVFRSCCSARYLRNRPWFRVIRRTRRTPRRPARSDTSLTSIRCSLSHWKVGTSIGMPRCSMCATAPTYRPRLSA